MRMASQNVFSLEQMLHGIGVLVVLWLLLKSLWVLAHVLRTHVLSERWKGVDLASYGPWAVVTGATSGIGKAYAHELARRGLNVVLISRSLEKLRQVAAEIEERHGRSTRVIQADFTRSSELYEPIRAALEGLEIGILVNNVGQAPTSPMLFLDMNNVDKFTQDLVHCNMLSYVKMTQLILPQMVARKKGIIINMSSTAAHVPSPLLLTYSATKVFDDFFSQALNTEYRSKGILVQSVLPMAVDSNLIIPVKNCWKLPAETFAHQALNTVGLTDRTNGCLNQFIQDSILSMIPDSLFLSPLGLSVLWFLWRNVLRQRQ